MSRSVEAEVCIECGAPAVWVRSTQFAGDHPYCLHHAQLESDFQREPDSYQFWYEIKYDDNGRPIQI